MRRLTLSDPERKALEALRDRGRKAYLRERAAALLKIAAGQSAHAVAAQGLLKKGETIVAIVTGNGLKDVASAMKAVGKPHSVAPEASELKRLVSELKLA